MCSGIRDAANLAWKLAFVVHGEACPALLDSYQAEREPHVSGIVARAIELGRVVCVADEAAAQARDARLKAAMAEPSTAARRSLAALPGLKSGLISDTQSAGSLFPQPSARRLPDGAQARLDDLLPRGFWLVTRGGPAAADELPPYVCDVGLGRDIEDDGTLAAWLGPAEAALVRPDRYVFGTGDAKTLVSQLRAAMEQAEIAMP
jgi:3-(3-hydroxy-phenyl)propionate hydroxylase